jgi:hypothetical protein
MKRALPLLPFLSALLPACQMTLGGRVETCGEYPAAGGPAAIVTRDQELCEVVRLRVGRGLEAANALPREKLDSLFEKTASWERKDTLADFLAVVRRDAGDAFADDVKRAVDDVLARPQRPLPPDCGEKCLVRGAARGARFALEYALPEELKAPAASGD